ncbi:MAG: glycosyltransferase family 4 protein [Oculatellaceae cyanobacterium bins.114]|nr:glycosyltransferase family 4 protein [Oculatellaceae cyanobacterium bins.114]
MKIAFISYEYPPDTAFGGIGTYVYQVAQMLHQCGHHVEVFTGSNLRSISELYGDVSVHRVQTTRQDFAHAIAPIFAERHRHIDFDVLEAPEIGAEAQEAIRLVPDMPLVVKLHTPSFLIRQINHVKPTLSRQARWLLGALRRGQIPKPYPTYSYQPETDLERFYTLQADEITTPSQALGDRLLHAWNLPSDRLYHLPNPYVPAPELLQIPVDTQTQTVTFVGRLEKRKGVLDLAQAIPQILKRHPHTQFRFVGASWDSPQPGLDMQRYIERMLRPYLSALEFTGAVPLDQIHQALAQTDICVLPSIWENFPNVCLEAMAAGRGVIGSMAGGMAEMLDGVNTGRLVPPRHPQGIVETVSELLEHPDRRIELGQKARDRVLSQYSLERLAPLQEASYQRAIARRKAIGSRHKIDRSVQVERLSQLLDA